MRILLTLLRTLIVIVLFISLCLYELHVRKTYVKNIDNFFKELANTTLSSEITTHLPQPCEKQPAFKSLSYLGTSKIIKGPTNQLGDSTLRRRAFTCNVEFCLLFEDYLGKTLLSMLIFAIDGIYFLQSNKTY